MKDYLINNILKYLTDEEKYSETKKEEIKYGLEALYLTLTKLIFIFAISFLLNIFLPTLLLIFLYSLLRAYSYGMHASTTLGCLVASTLLFILPAYYIDITTINTDIHMFIVISSMLIFVFYAPADTYKRPIINANHRNSLKIKSLLIIIVYVISSFMIKNIIVVNSLLYILILQSVLISPVSYWLSNQPYQNYKNYKKEDGK